MQLQLQSDADARLMQHANARNLTANAANLFLSASVNSPQTLFFAPRFTII